MKPRFLSNPRLLCDLYNLRYSVKHRHNFHCSSWELPQAQAFRGIHPSVYHDVRTGLDGCIVKTIIHDVKVIHAPLIKKSMVRNKTGYGSGYVSTPREAKDGDSIPFDIIVG